MDVSAGPKEDQIVVFLGSQKGMLLKVMDTSGKEAFLSNSVFLEEMDIYNPEKYVLFIKKKPSKFQVEWGEIIGVYIFVYAATTMDFDFVMKKTTPNFNMSQ